MRFFNGETENSEGRCALFAPLAAIGRAMQEVFDPHRFLAEFSRQLQRVLPHDRVLVAYLEEGGHLSVLAEHAVRGPELDGGRYTLDFEPSGRHAPAEVLLGQVLAGEPALVR